MAGNRIFEHPISYARTRLVNYIQAFLTELAVTKLLEDFESRATSLSSGLILRIAPSLALSWKQYTQDAMR